MENSIDLRASGFFFHVGSLAFPCSMLCTIDEREEGLMDAPQAQRDFFNSESDTWGLDALCARLFLDAPF